jgi:phenylpyruvate tautomerase PptA (4-oxalocrotonate tautomerase family)
MIDSHTRPTGGARSSNRATKIPKDYICVVFEPMPQDSWSVGGSLVSEKK